MEVRKNSINNESFASQSSLGTLGGGLTTTATGSGLGSHTNSCVVRDSLDSLDNFDDYLQKAQFNIGNGISMTPINQYLSYQDQKMLN
jgi:hypothetical protein